MKLLIILSNHIFDKKWRDNIKCLNDYMKTNDIEYDYCGISNQNDFDVYEDIIQFKYKIINTKKQLSKICDFITEYKLQLDQRTFQTGTKSKSRWGNITPKTINSPL
jgi:hypothetical protein